MAAFTGWAVVGAGLTLPGDLTREGLHFADIPRAGLAAWDAVPGIGKVRRRDGDEATNVSNPAHIPRT